MLPRLSVVAVKIQSLVNVAETLTAADAIDAFSPQFSANPEMNKRNPVRGTFSPVPSIPGKRNATISFEVELIGSHALGAFTPGGSLPASAPLQACGVAEALSAGVSSTCTPITSGVPLVTVAIYENGKKKLIWNARGKARFICETGKPVRIRFEFTGSDYTITDATMLAATFDDTLFAPIFQGVTFSVNSYAADISKFELDLGPELSTRTSAAAASGYGEARITGRAPMITFDPEDVVVATHDFWAALRAGTLMALSAAWGSVAGNRFAISCPAIQYAGISEGERDGHRTLDISAQPCGEDGDDDWQLVNN